VAPSKSLVLDFSVKLLIASSSAFFLVRSRNFRFHTWLQHLCTNLLISQFFQSASYGRIWSNPRRKFLFHNYKVLKNLLPAKHPPTSGKAPSLPLAHGEKNSMRRSKFWSAQTNSKIILVLKMASAPFQRDNSRWKNSPRLGNSFRNFFQRTSGIFIDAHSAINIPSPCNASSIGIYFLFGNPGKLSTSSSKWWIFWEKN